MTTTTESAINILRSEGYGTADIMSAIDQMVDADSRHSNEPAFTAEDLDVIRDQLAAAGRGPADHPAATVRYRVYAYDQYGTEQVDPTLPLAVEVASFDSDNMVVEDLLARSPEFDDVNAAIEWLGQYAAGRGERIDWHGNVENGSLCYAWDGIAIEGHAQ